VTRPGNLLAGRYRLARRIAVGGMGAVWKAFDTRLGRAVAVKVLHPELAADDECLHRFRAEAGAAAALQHPGVAAVHDYGESPPDARCPRAVYLVMELVPGESLAAVIARTGRCSARFTADVLAQTAAALQAAHQRALVHRDVKPGNILLAHRRRGERIVKLTDFGIAKAAGAAPLTVAGRVMGSPHYIAPERVRGQPAAPASDVYSLATCGYECLAGVRPFRDENALAVATMHAERPPPPLPADVPADLRGVIEAGMAKDPSRRYATGGDFAAALAGTPAPPAASPSGGVPPRYGGPTGRARPSEPCRRNRDGTRGVSRWAGNQSSEASGRSGQAR
jgi:serine/threonine-protein kinase